MYNLINLQDTMIEKRPIKSIERRRIRYILTSKKKFQNFLFGIKKRK